MSSSPGRRRLWRTAAVWLLCSGVGLALLAGSNVPRGAGPSARGAASRGSAHEAVAGALPLPAARPADSAAIRTRQLTALLERRAAAVLHRDRAGFLATVDPGQATFRRAQDRLFTALSGLRFAQWSYALDAPAIGRSVPHPRRYGSVPVYAPRSLVIRYALAGFDPRPAATAVAATFTLRGGRWLLASDADFDPTGRGTQREIWDYGPIATSMGRRTLVVGVAARRAALAGLARRADAAVPVVSALCGAGWGQRVVLVVPADAAQLAALAGRSPAQVQGMAAIAVAQLAATGPSVAVGNRILVNPSTLRLAGPAQQVVLTHETTHVALRQDTLPGAPQWLVEGVADYVAYRGVRLPAAAIAPHVRDEVRAGRLPARLPPDAEFDPGSAGLEEAYEKSWLAVRALAERVGERRLASFYRAVAESADPSAALGVQLHQDLGTSLPDFVADWRSSLRRVLLARVPQ